MSVYGKKLHIRKNGSIQNINLYTTADETQNSYIRLRDGSTVLYAAIGSTSNANASWLRVRKSGTVYAVLTQSIDIYGITGTITGSYLNKTINCEDCDCDCMSPDQCNCMSDCTTNIADYRYQIKLTFTGVTKFPIQYTSKSGAVVQIAKSQVSGSGTTYTYTSGYVDENNSSVNESFDISKINSLFPSSGVSGWSTITSINVGSSNAGQYGTETVNCGKH